MKKSIKGILSTILATAMLLGNQVQSSAAHITVNGTMTANANQGSILSGDRFNYSFTFDDQTIDQSAETYKGLFNSAVSAFSLTRQASNLGTWDPAPVVFSVSPVTSFAVNANAENIALQVNGFGSTNVGVGPFHSIYLSYNWVTISGGVTNVARNFIDTGSGQTFAEIVGESPLNFTLIGPTSYGQINGGPIFRLEQTGVTVAVPEPLAASVMLLGMAVVASRKLRAKSKQGNGRFHPLPR